MNKLTDKEIKNLPVGTLISCFEDDELAIVESIAEIKQGRFLTTVLLAMPGKGYDLSDHISVLINEEVIFADDVNTYYVLHEPQHSQIIKTAMTKQLIGATG